MLLKAIHCLVLEDEKTHFEIFCKEVVQVGSPLNEGGQYLENGIGTYVLTGKKSKKASFKHDTKVTKVVKKHGNIIHQLCAMQIMMNQKIFSSSLFSYRSHYILTGSSGRSINLTYLLVKLFNSENQRALSK